MSLSCPALRHNYSEESLAKALEDIRGGTKSIREASREYGVPRGTIQDRIHGRVKEGPRKMGPKSILTKDEEDNIVQWCCSLAKCCFPRKIDDVLNSVQQLVTADQRQTPFKDNRPGKKWYAAFLRRNPQVTIREAEGITKGRAIITEEAIKKWFSDLKEYLVEENALDILDDPQRIMNGDETSFSMCPKTGKVLAPKGWKNVYVLNQGNEKETITVLLVFNAKGETLTPMVVFPYKRPPKAVIESMPLSWTLGISETGCMRSDVFFEYIANTVNPWLNNNDVTKPVLLFVDGHKSHLTMELSTFCSANGIIL
ncbi:uncharacterized protein LOC113471547 [Diaphorina citri]|uniref:Uncharacterized protein LOC113471547 n=1 Tax=Diaphorina citri TaxID=121845 RepID=A0A3Q0JHK5_DIACI|nr:uncharacterized protein LOC113471547 [Diaphorina citri]